VFRRRFELLSIVGSPVYRGDSQEMGVDFDIHTMTINNSELDKQIKASIDELCKLYLKSLRIRYYEDR